ncbi:HAD family hydrolase [Flavimaricola marinus]|uniref:phosphoglycolate phosphatase n=1 Tax=Flavimaricola marinus TaxID=1819565 RepID=A0A238LIQ3_9RHOB|nr:HAD family hydrolase [Flavimaricola marinus]SMY08750.1 Phosphoglycolate phosphatase [Flavimaricola marinus]
MSAPPIQAVVFDKDGTLFDFHATWSAWCQNFLISEAKGDSVRLAALADALGYDLAGHRFLPHSIVIAHTTEEIAQALLPLFPDDTRRGLSDRMNGIAEDVPQTPATDLAPFLTELRGMGLALGVATNDAEAPARAHLAAAGVEPLFDFIAGYDSGFGGKPAPGQLLAFAKAAGAAPAACLMVGDSRHDLVAARAAGMRPVGVLTGLARAEDLAPLAEVVLPSIATLPAWIAAQR